MNLTIITIEGIVYTLDALHCQKKTFEIANGNNGKKKTPYPG
jgi:predicted transposase YbfD/YdcC